MFALAVVLFAMQMKRFPFDHGNVTLSPKYQLYLNGDRQGFWPPHPPVSDDFKDLIFGMIVEDPE